MELGHNPDPCPIPGIGELHRWRSRNLGIGDGKSPEHKSNYENKTAG